MLTKLKKLDLGRTQITDAGCADLASRLASGELPALHRLYLYSIPASAEAIAAVYEARANLKSGEDPGTDSSGRSESEEGEEDGEEDD